MTKDNLIYWIRDQQTILDEIIKLAANDYYNKHKDKKSFIFDVKETSGELFNLCEGKDLCYDRPTIGFTYSLWYHSKRVNTFMNFFINQIWEAKDEGNIDIFDLGAGTGAVQWSIGLAYCGLIHLGFKNLSLRVINIDTSPFMLDYNQNYLWPKFVEFYPEVKNINIAYRINSWVNPLDNDKEKNVWLCASYLFDHTENKDDIQKDFEKLINDYKPTRVMLLTSSQQNKIDFLDQVGTSIEDKGYHSNFDPLANQIFSGNLQKVNDYRNEINTQHRFGFKGSTAWNVDSLYGKVFKKKQYSLGLPLPEVKLYTDLEKNRKKINLTEEQEKASKLSDSPTLIIGPAGCGKSVVLTERIKNLVEEKDYDPNLKILLTTFNKELVKLLGDWLQQLLDMNRCKRTKGDRQQHSYFKFTDSREHNIFVFHFDILPTHIGKIKTKAVFPNHWHEGYEQFHFYTMEKIVGDYVKKKRIKIKDNERILDPNFLLDEYHRVFYGNQCNNESYLNPPTDKFRREFRSGRGKGVGVKQRKIIFDIINSYLTYLNTIQIDTFIYRRDIFLQQIRNNEALQNKNKFTNIFVDELQDCTRADYDIFYELLEYPNNIVLSGDLAQSIHIGKSAYYYRHSKRKEGEQKQFDKLKLNGSFRLPFRISECLRPISTKIKKEYDELGEDVSIIEPCKGSPPGARPIVVFAPTLPEITEKIKEIFDCYKIFGFDSVTIFERDHELKNSLSGVGISAESETTLRMKGLEKPCVLWSVRIDVDTETEVKEFVYTILTRTSSVLVIVLSDIQPKYIPIIKILERDRLIFWDNESQKMFYEICAKEIVEEDDEDEYIE